MSVSETYSPYSNATQGSFHFYSSTSIADSDNEQEGYTGAPSYSNDESNLEDDISEGMEGISDSEEENGERYHNNGPSFTTTEDEEDDDEMEMDVCSSETESEDTEEEEQINNNSNIQSQTFDSGNSFNIIRNNNGSPNGNNGNNNNNNILPPIQLTPRNPSISTSNINNNRFMGSDPSFMDRFLPLHHSSRNGSSARDHRVNNGGLSIPSFSDNFSSPSHQNIFRLPNVVSHPSSSYPNSTDATVASSLSSTSSISSSTSNQRKQSPLRFGFPEESHDNEEDEDEDGTSSSASYDAASSRKRTRSISNDWSNISQSNFSQPIQFGSLEPVNRDISSRPSISQNLRSTQLSQSSPPPNNRSTGNRISLNFLPDNEDVHPAPLSPPSNLLSLNSLYSSTRIGSFSQSSTSTAANSSNDHPFARSQTHSQTHSQSQSQSQTPFFYNRTVFPPRRFNHPIPQPIEPSSLRRPTSNHNGNEQQEYNANFTPTSPDVPVVMFPEVHPTDRRHHHQHNNNHISSLSQAPRASSSSSSTRWSPRDPRGGRAEMLSRPIMPNPNFQRRGAMIHQRNNNSNNNHPNFGGSMQEAVRVFASDEEQDTAIEVPEGSDNEVNVTASIPARQWRPPRRHESRQDNSTHQDNNNTRDSHRSRALAVIAAQAAVSAARNNTSNDGPLSSDEQIARRMQAYEYSSMQNTIDEQNVLTRFLSAGRARSATNRRDATSGPSSSSRSDSSRRNISTRGPVTRLPEILSHDRHHHEERSNEPRSRASRGSQSRNGGRSSSAGSYLHHQFFPHPLLGNLIDSGEIELEDFLDLLPVWGNGIAANPDNYLDEDEFDSSYEGLLRLCERIGDAKPKGVPEDMLKTLPTNAYIAGKSKTVEERCTICLTDYEVNDRLRDLPCSHDFHQDCIDAWFKNSDKCPICRRSVIEN